MTDLTKQILTLVGIIIGIIVIISLLIFQLTL